LVNYHSSRCARIRRTCEDATVRRQNISDGLGGDLREHLARLV
jgi:hypothetical protein